MILVVCLNPALQRTLWFENFIPGEVNRAVKKAFSAGGKGVNVARVIAELGEEVVLLTLLGGQQGNLVRQYLAKDNIPFHAVEIHCETRSCTTIIDIKSQKQTEAVEEGNRIDQSDVEAIKGLFNKLLDSSRFLIVSGTAMKGFSKSIYPYFIRTAKQKSIRALIDASGDLLRNSIGESPYMIKPNWKEMEVLTQNKIKDIKTMKHRMNQIAKEGVNAILVTKGSSSAILFHEAGFYHITFPKVKALNPIGSGDGVAAGIGAGIFQGRSMIESVRLGMACGTANCKTPIAGTVSPQEVDRILPDIQIEPI